MSTTPNRNLFFSLAIFFIFLIVSVSVLIWQVTKNINITLPARPANTEEVEISVAYAPELEPIYTQATADFNKSFEENKNPINGENLKDGDLKIKVKAENISSGEARTKIVATVNKADNFKPTIYAPTFSAWLDLVNFETGKNIYDLSNFKSSAKSPVGIAIWESRLRAIQNKYPNTEIGLKEIQEVFNSPKGWQDYQASINRQQVYFGFTNPQISSTAVSALLAQYYSASDPKIDQLTTNEVKNPQIQSQVQNFQKVIRQYSNNTVVFRDYISRGPDYIDMLPLAENDLVFVNQGKNENKPPEKLVMMYPKEGSVVHDYPLAVAQADWVSENQKKASEVFINYILSDQIQTKFLENGFRPASYNVAINSPLNQDFGVDVSKPSKVLKIPTGEVISQIQTSFAFVKKPSKIALLVDTSGSMSGQKIENAKKALEVFVNKTLAKNQVALYTFDSSVRTVLDFQPLESGRGKIAGAASELQVQGGTSLFDALAFGIDSLSTDKDKNTIKAIVLLSDGQDTSSTQNNLRSILDKIDNSQKSSNPILIIPIAYGSDADLNELNAIARGSKTTVQTGDVTNISKLLENISSYF